MHVEAWRYVLGTVRSLPPRLSVVEFGGRNFNGSVRPMFAHAESYISLDLFPGHGVDWVGDALEYMPTRPIDTVVCCEVLEHAPAWPDLLRHAHHILPHDGVLILTCAAPPREPHSGVDGGELQDGEYYANVEPADFLSVMDQLNWTQYLHTTDPRGDLYCVARK